MNSHFRSTPTSLDDLLSASRDRFDNLFVHQMRGGRAAQLDDPAFADPSPDAAPQGPSNVIADLNRQFGFNWSSRTLRHDVSNGQVNAEVAIAVEDREVIETGTSQIGEAETEEAALERAVNRALRTGAARLTEQSLNLAPDRSDIIADGALTSEPADLVNINRLETALSNLRSEMACTLARNRVSSGPTNPDASSAMVMDGRGRMISGESGSFLAHMFEAGQMHLAAGDVLLISDPFGCEGVVRNSNTWLLVCSVTCRTDLVGYVSVQAQFSDVGGGALGSAPIKAASVFDEGMRVPPVKLFEAGVLNQPLLDAIQTNCRTPETNRADTMAMVAACHAGAAQLSALYSRFGPNLYHKACAAMRERTRNAIRTRIVELIPQEPQSFEDVIDSDGQGNGPFQLRLTVWREGEHAYFDWTGTAAEAAGPINLYLHVGAAKAFIGQYLTSGLGAELTANDGFYDLIHLTLPEGSVLKPRFPAAVGRHEATLARHLDVLGAAIGRHMPQTLEAAGVGPAPVFSFSGTGFRLVDTVPQGRPGRPARDGVDGIELLSTTNAENLEGIYPVVIERFQALPGTGGAGKFRGGNGVEKVYRVLSAGHVSLFDDRDISRPWGVCGGRPGASSQKRIERASGERLTLPAKLDGLHVEPGDRIVFRTAGGGGFGNPLTRDPIAVRHDVVQGLLSADAAASEFGVVIEGRSFDLNLGATEQLRRSQDRLHPDTKLFDRGDQA
ncbi:MAG: hydantoinase B/oxoprolinase family protein [Rhizobiaceae bacterium]